MTADLSNRLTYRREKQSYQCVGRSSRKPWRHSDAQHGTAALAVTDSVDTLASNILVFSGRGSAQLHSLVLGVHVRDLVTNERHPRMFNLTILVGEKVRPVCLP